MISMGTVWDRTTEFLSDNLSAIIPIAFFVIFLPATLSACIRPLTAMPGTTAMAIQVLSIALSLVSLWGQLSISALVLDPAAGRGAATALAGKRLLPLIGVWVLLLAGLFVLMLPVPVTLALIGYDFQAAMNGKQASIPAGASGFLLIYCLLLIVVVFWLAARLALVTPVLLVERLGLGVFRRSFKLTRPITLKIIGVILLLAIVAGVASMATNFVFGAIFGLMSSATGPVTLATVLTAVMVTIVTTIFTVIAAAFTGRLYLGVRDARLSIVDSL